MKIKTRIAPSPTGFFHIGNARTALFNFLFAQKNGGEFLLRIEDTDKERSKKEYEEDIIAGLKWLRLNWDGQVIRQSEKTKTHRKYLEKLLEEKKAFYCFHSQDELESEKKEQELNKAPFKHDCAHKHSKETSSGNGVTRLANPNKTILFKDLIRGEVSFESSLLGDIVIAKGLDTPLYHLAVVIDDFESKITHVIRGEDHLSNTPKQILIQEALEINQPIYAHLPLILGADKSKLSKRHGGTALTEYKDQGYLPEAMINFMALLGWHPTHNQEIFNFEELIKEFDLARVQKGGAVFDINKLDSINHRYIKQLSHEELANKLKPHLDKFNPSPDQLTRIAHAYEDRLKKFSEIGELAKFIFEPPDYSSNLLIWKNASPNTIKENLELAAQTIEKIPENNFDLDTVTTELMIVADQKGRGEFLWPLRVALAGADKSPAPFELAFVLGKKDSLLRINIALQKL